MATLSRLKTLRNEKNMTGQELAKVFNVTKTAISNWENGNRNPDNENLVRIAKYFDVSVDYLLGITDIRNGFTEPNPSTLSSYEAELSEKEKQDVENMAKDVFDNFLFNAYRGELPTDPETEEKVKATILDLFTDIKKKNKIKYNPNKNK